LREVLPPFGSVLNPVDPTASVFSGPTGNAKLRHVLEALLDDPNVDSVIVSNSSLHGAVAVKTAEEIIALDRSTPKSIFVSWSAREALASDAFDMLEAANIPFFRTPSRCGNAMGALTRFALACRKNEVAGKTQTNAAVRAPLRQALSAKAGF